MVDETWDTVSLLDIADYKNGLAMQKFRPNVGDKGLPVLKIRELGQESCGNDAERCRSDIDESVTVHDGDLVFSWSGTLLLKFWAGGDAGLNQHLFKVTSGVYPSWFYYAWTKHHLARFTMLAKDRATTMGHIKRSALEESEVLLPSKKKLAMQTKHMQPIIDQVIANKIEIRKLAALRDALLPKLMSGEIDVSKIDLTQLNSHLAERPSILLRIRGHPYIPATVATAVTQACVGTVKVWFFLELGTTLGPPGGPPKEKGHRLKPVTCCFLWSRGPDLNQRPSGYEPDELPDCSTPRY